MLTSTRSAFSLLSLLTLSAAVACGAKTTQGGGLTVGDDGDDSGSGSGSQSGSGGGSGSDQMMFGDDGSTSFGDDGGMINGCASSSSKGQQQALDVYIMLDQSASMIGPKWTGVTAALNSFIQQPLTGVSVGIQYFGLNFADCTAADYAVPDVEIAPLPGVASKIMTSIMNHAPISGTPTQAAEQGAIQHAQDWAKKHPGDAVVVILATDGDPDACTVLPDPVTPVAQAAMAGATGTPKILTFVIGVGSDLTNLNQIAMGGGTGSAFIVDTSMNVNQQFLDALNKIRGNALGCNYKIPAPTTGGTTDFSKVNVQFTDSKGTKTVFPQVSGKSACPASGNAWYYDNPTAPTQIVLCTSSCGTVSAGGEVDILTGCMTVVR